MDSADRIGATFEALLLQPLLAPLAQGLDALGNYGTDLLAQTITERDGAFAALLKKQLEESDATMHG